MKAYLDSMVTLPMRALSNAQLESALEDLTVAYKTMGMREAQRLSAYTEDGQWLSVPRAYGLQLISKLGLDLVNRTSPGVPFPFPVDVTHEGDYAYQGPFVAEILRASEKYDDFLVHAATGKGKSVCSLSVIQKRGKAGLVVVDQDNLMKQWVSEAKTFLKLEDEQIGVVQGDRCDYEGCGVVIAMIQSLVRREYPPEFYDYFGTVVFDEAHTVGAPTFSEALSMFPAEVRFGVSATVDRRDALQKLLHANLGQVAVSLLDKHDPSFVYYIESDTVYSEYANKCDKPAPMLSELCSDGERNRKLVDAILWLYESGRDVLVISDRIEQLENLRAMAYYAGIPYEETGLYCGQRNLWKYALDPKAKKRPPNHERGAEYSPVLFSRVRKAIPKAVLAEIKKDARVVFATYGMFSKGVDVARLAGGVDASPRTRAEQVHGRILRSKGDKLVPIWVTVRDVNSFRLEGQFVNRIREYAASSAEIYQWRPEINGVRFRDVKALVSQARKAVKRLKQQHTTIRADGSYTLTTRPMRSEQSAQPVRTTARRVR